jgi:hypothetical protein
MTAAAATADHDAGDGEPTEALRWPLLEELRQLEAELHGRGVVCALYQSRDVLLIGTAGGGIITVGLTSDRAKWWGNSVTSSCVTRELAGTSVSTVVRAEVARHAALAARRRLDTERGQSIA